MMSEHPPRPGDWVVVTDDDVGLRTGSLVTFLRVAAAAGLQLAQPARSGWKQASHPVTYPQPGCVARLTTFVEIGPIFAVAPDRRADLVPFPDDAGMGWGLDADWSVSAAREGWRLGVVDCVQVEHPDAIGEEYEAGAEAGRSRTTLARAGVERIEELQHTRSHWWFWQRRAPWPVGASHPVTTEPRSDP